MQGELSMEESLCDCGAPAEDWETKELIEEREEERECLLLSECCSLVFASELFSRPREAMSSTKEGRVVIATTRRPEGDPGWPEWQHGCYNGLESGSSTLETEAGTGSGCHGL